MNNYVYIVYLGMSWYAPVHPVGTLVTPRINRGVKRDRTAGLGERSRDNIMSASKEAKMSRTRARTYRRRRRQNRRRRGIIRRYVPSVPIPKGKVVRMRAVHQQQITHTSGNIMGISVSMNDITDPFGSAGSGQPLYTDQLRNMWSRAVVLGSKVTWKMHNGGTVAVLVGINPMPESRGNTLLTQTEWYMELPGSKNMLLSPDVDNRVLVHKVNFARHMGVRKIKDENELHVDFDGEVSPTRQAYWHVWSRPIDNTTAVVVDYVITVEYIVYLYDRVIPARSIDA